MTDSLPHRYYGLMLGFFVSLLRLEVPEETYQSHRSRIDEVLRELEVKATLPSSRAAFGASIESLMQTLLPELRARDQELADFVVLGFHSLRLLVGDAEPGEAGRRARHNFDGVVARYGLDQEAMLAVVEPGWDSGRVDDELYTELVSRFYRLAVMSLWPLSKQERVCFVIMPFGLPFRDYYFTFYRPSLEAAGYRCLRAWVGLTNEHYLTLLAVLISRCSAALADVSADVGSTPNLNVVHEIGLNMGLENVTFLLRNEQPVQLPSNFTGLPIAQYESGAGDFPAGEVKRLAAVLEELGAATAPQSDINVVGRAQ